MAIRRGGARRGRLAALLALLGALLALATAATAAGRGAAGRRTRPASATATVSVDRTHPGTTVPQDFLGLSFELSSLPQMARYADRGNLVTLLRSLGPGVLRFGGVSADTRMAWTDNRTPRPSWASGVVDAQDLRQLGALAAASGWHVVLTLGLVHYEPQAAAREAAAAKAALGEWLEGIELGNEPNAWASHGFRAEPWTFVQYDAEVSAYRGAIEAAAPGIPLLGPDVSGSSAYESWGLGEAIAQRPVLLTGHHYPLGCEQIPAPSISRLLSAPIRRKEVGSLRRYMSTALASNTPFRLDETNTVSCGGQAGISNTFASALWAADYLSRAMSLGVAGVNLHGNVANCKGYSPICAPGPEALSTGALGAQPEWYALLLLKALIGSRPLATTVIRSPRQSNIQAAGFLTADDGLRFVIVDDDPPGKRKVAVRLRIGERSSRASVLSLSAPSITALSGVLLGGAAVAPDGTWRPAPLPRVPSRAGVATVELAPGSAALVSVSGAGGAGGAGG
jgi:hypothetical protein